LRHILYSGLLIAALAWGDDGITPRSSSSDYPVHQDIADATIAAVRVPEAQLKKNVPADFAKKYMVVEVAIYPKAGASLEVVSTDFVLRLADGESHRPDTPEEVAGTWRPHNNPSPEIGSKEHVTTETGVIVQNGQDPNTGRKGTSVATWEGVGVDNYPTQAPPSGSSRVDADWMEGQLAKWALPEGKITSPAAGYLYFPIKKGKNALELRYAHDDWSANLTLPAASK